MAGDNNYHENYFLRKAKLRQFAIFIAHKIFHCTCSTCIITYSLHFVISIGELVPQVLKPLTGANPQHYQTTIKKMR